jgi:hypothetical protein
MWQRWIDATMPTQAQDNSDFDSNANPLLAELRKLVVAGRAGTNVNALSNLQQARPWAYNVKHAACMVCSSPRHRRNVPAGVQSPI